MKMLLIVATAATLLTSASHAGKYENIGDVCKDIESDILDNLNQIHDIHQASKSKYYNAYQGTKEGRELLASLDWVSTMYDRLGCHRFGGL